PRPTRRPPRRVPRPTATRRTGGTGGSAGALVRSPGHRSAVRPLADTARRRRDPGPRVSVEIGLHQPLGRHPGVDLSGADRGVTEQLLDGADVGSVVEQDRKSTRLNSSHVKISYAVF